MSHNWSSVTDKLFGILKGRGYRLQMYTKTGAKTLDPHEATRFFATVPSDDRDLSTFNVLVSLHDEDSSSHVDIKTPKLANDQDFAKVLSLKNSIQTNLGDLEGLSVDWYKFDHDIDLRDDVVNNIAESKDISKPYGSTRSSYQNIGSSRLIIRHSDSINEEKRGSRWRHIRNIFIETKLGERFRYPHAHIAGARAMARHLANDGRFTDPTAKIILKISEDYIKLKKAARAMHGHADDDDRSIKIKDAISKLSKDSKRLAGSRGYGKAILELARQTQDLDAKQVLTMRDRLAEDCGCDRNDADKMDSLHTAARYILIMPNRRQDMDLDDGDELMLTKLVELAGIADI